MRTKLFLCFAALLAAAAFPVLAFGQFQQPTPDELKMTSDPKAPGASAVYLNIEEIEDDNLHYRSFHARIKVLTEKGKELGTVTVPYLAGDTKVTGIKARTIHPDGAVIPLEGKPEDLLRAKREGMAFSEKIFTLPGVDVGSILEYTYTIRYDDDHYSSPTWEVQQPYFVHKAHYFFSPFKAFLTGSQNATSRYLVDSVTGDVASNIIWWVHLPEGAQLQHDAIGRFSLDVTDVPATPDEEWMPPIRSLLYKVDFYYKGAYSAQEYWEKGARHWSKDVDHFAEPSKAIREAVAGLVAPTDTPIEKAKKLYAAVQALDNTDYTRKKSESEMKKLKMKEARRAEDTWIQKGGSSDDIALLYLAMLRAAGVPAYAMKVVNREDGVFDPSYMTMNQFDDTLVAVQDGENLAPTDPGEKLCPFLSLSWRHAGADALRQSDKGPGITKYPLQNYTQNTIVRSGDITIDEHGKATGSFTIVMTGQEALNWRQVQYLNDEEEVKKRFDRQLQNLVLEGMEAHIDHFVGMDDPNLNLLAIVKVEGSMGAATSKRLILPGFFFESRARTPFVNQEKRLEPVDMQYAEKITDQVIYHFPAGMTVEGAPQDANVPWPQHAVYIAKSKAEPGQLTVARLLARAFAQAKPEEYQDLRGFYQKVAAEDQQQIVLRAAPLVSGN